MSDRIPKINTLVKQYIGEIILRDLSLKPGVFVTVSKVDTSPDLRYTRVFVSIFPEKETDYAEKTLIKEVYHIQGKFNQKMTTKPIPKIEFKIDTTEIRASEIEELLKKI